MVRIYYLLVASQVLAAVATASPKCTFTTEEKPAAVGGWPVLVAVRFPVRASITLNLSLSAHHDVHTTLTLTHDKQDGKEVGMVEVKLHTKMAITLLDTAALLPDSHWGKLSLTKEHKKLELKVHTEAQRSSFTTTAVLNTTHHLPVDTVSCTGLGCKLVDLQCLYSNGSHTDKSNRTTEQVSGASIAYDATYEYYTLGAALLLLLIVCMLFFVWRSERKKFRERWSRHSQTARLTRSSMSWQEGNTPNTAAAADAVVFRNERKGEHCTFAYNGPCIGDSD